MPQIIRTIDDYFIEKKRDLYLLRFSKMKTKDEKLAQLMIMKWLKDNCPNILVEPIYPITNDSGFLALPWDNSHSIDFDKESLLLFTNKWEDENGNSKNSFFQCYIFKYEKDL